MTPEVFTKNRLVLPQSHPDCAACDELLNALDRSAVSGGRVRLRLRTLLEMTRKEAPDVYRHYLERVAAGDPWVVGAPGPDPDITLPARGAAGPEGGQHAI